MSGPVYAAEVKSSVMDANVLEEQPYDNPSDEDRPVLQDKANLVFERNISDIESKDKFRVDLMRRLCKQKVWVPKDERQPKHQSLIIFDWDDTLMYTSFLIHGRYDMCSQKQKAMLERIEKASLDLLQMAVRLGRTFIITNAQAGWVESCVENYMPSLRQILEEVSVISARTAHEYKCSHASEWKKHAFLELGRQLDKQVITNLISIGDSMFEMDAVRLLGKEFSQCLVKTVKLQESPTPEELMKELELVVPKFQQIVQKGINMKIHLERRVAK